MACARLLFGRELRGVLVGGCNLVFRDFGIGVRDVVCVRPKPFILVGKD